MKQAVAAGNSSNGSHLSFFTEVEVKFVCIPRPLERSDREDGGELRYRVTHRVNRWKDGEAPKLLRVKTDGDLPLID